jgi:hypothetical protein
MKHTNLVNLERDQTARFFLQFEPSHIGTWKPEVKVHTVNNPFETKTVLYYLPNSRPTTVGVVADSRFLRGLLHGRHLRRVAALRQEFFCRIHQHRPGSRLLFRFRPRLFEHVAKAMFHDSEQFGRQHLQIRVSVLHGGDFHTRGGSHSTPNRQAGPRGVPVEIRSGPQRGECVE